MPFENQSFHDLASIIHDNTKPEVMSADRGSMEKAAFAVVPRGMEVKSLKPLLDEYREKPDRRTGTIKTDTIQSLIDITNRFSGEASAIFAKADVADNRITASLTTIFNYHPVGDNNTNAGFADHRAEYAFPISKEFKHWLASNGKVMSQIDFAMFVEDRVGDLASPEDSDKAGVENLTPMFADPIKMLELSRDLEINSQETVKSKKNLSSGEGEIKFTSDHVDASGQPIRIPNFFIVNVPIFEGGEPERTIVRLRYRVKEGTVVWWFDLYRIDRTFQAAFDFACEHVRQSTSLPLYVGSPESQR